MKFLSSKKKKSFQGQIKNSQKLKKGEKLQPYKKSKTALMSGKKSQNSKKMRALEEKHGGKKQWRIRSKCRKDKNGR